MSHYTVLAIIRKGSNQSLETLLAPYDENERVEPYVAKTKAQLIAEEGTLILPQACSVNKVYNFGEIAVSNGATLFYGEHNSAAAVRDSAVELEKRIEQIVRENGCEKVNIIAHSKGGLDSRAAIALTSAGKYVASLTTINTPHRGCEFADYLLKEIPKKGQQAIADKYNLMAAKLGDHDPDFLSAVYDLTSENCQKRNETVHDDPNIYYQSVGSVLRQASTGQFPLNFTYHLVKYFDGENDGLVGEGSFKWGSDFEMLRNTNPARGISHGDVIDLSRENIEGFDVREVYVQLVSRLREMGF